MKNHRCFIYLLIIAFTIFSGVSVFAQKFDLENDIAKYRKGEITVKAKPGSKVEIEQVAHEFWFGCAISDGIFNGRASENDQKMYKEKFLENFNSAVTENAVKWPGMERRKGEVDYSLVDAMLKWTGENNIPLRGHNIFWGIEQFIQPWIKELTDAELEQTLKNRAETLTARYKGRFAEYDLNNEMIHGNYYEERLGPDITKKMAEWCQNGDPDVKLYLNDYDILTGKKLPEYMAQIRLLLNQGVAHCRNRRSGTFTCRIVRPCRIETGSRFTGSIQITNSGYRVQYSGQRSKYYNNRNLEMTAEEEEQKSTDLVDYYRICFAHPAVEGILMWGFWEGANWIPQSSLYKRDWSPTPAATAYQNLIFKTWWTTGKGKITRQGNYSMSAFYGKYKVTVNGETKTADLTKTAGKVTLEF
jgi:endo-1,4-beta-xylanase